MTVAADSQSCRLGMYLVGNPVVDHAWMAFVCMMVIFVNLACDDMVYLTVDEVVSPLWLRYRRCSSRLRSGMSYNT